MSRTNTKLWIPGQADLVLPAAFAPEPRKGFEKVDLAALGIIPGLAGGRQGTHVAADVVTQTADGRDLNAIWSDFMDLLNAVNANRQKLLQFLTFEVAAPVESVAQPGTGVNFEPSSEFGEPVGSRIVPTYFNMAYSFRWWDLAARYTWQYLADATAAMVESVANASVEAYDRLQLNEVFKTIFNNNNLTATINQQPYTVYKFYNADGTVPPTYKSNTFDGLHTHYKTTGSQGTNSATLEPSDVDVLIIDDFASHGYSMENGYTLVMMVNTVVGNTIRNFRSTANGGTGRYDFIPAQGQPGQLAVQNTVLLGQGQVPATLGGLTVIGSYGPLLIVQDDYMPTTHVFSFATGGPNSLQNPVGVRQHANPALRGLRLVKGRQPNYPLIDSYWATGFGTGVRQRGAGIVLQLASGTSYSIPTQFQ